MPSPRINIPGTIPPELVDGISHLRDELGVPGDFAPAVLAEARAAAATPKVVGRDLTDLPFITIDPESSRDLDQAMHIERQGEGYKVWYAIANVAAWVEPGGVIDSEAHLRGCTYYAPNSNVPLHPTELSHGAASLLADGVARPAYVWQLELDAAGEVTSTVLERAMVKNTAKLSYVGCQADLDAGHPHETIVLLREVGKLREDLELARGGASLPIPEQEIVADGDTWRLEYRTPLPIEGWNAQISLMTGIEAARLMIGARVGILRTLPPAEAAAIAKLRRSARALGIQWAQDMAYAEFLRTLDPSKPAHKAMLNQCTALFRGAGYMSFDGVLPAEDHKHNALATHYAHTTAPLRRLVDRYVLEICACICAAEPIPAWCTDALDALPMEMDVADRREKRYERGIVDLVEALVLSGRIGETFRATVLEVDARRGLGTILLDDPAVESLARGRMPFGGEVEVELTGIEAGKVYFDVVGSDHERRPPREPQESRPPREQQTGRARERSAAQRAGEQVGRGVQRAGRAAHKLVQGAQELRRGFDRGRRSDQQGDGLPGKPYGR